MSADLNASGATQQRRDEIAALVRKTLPRAGGFYGELTQRDCERIADALIAEVESLTAERDRLREAVEDVLPWIEQNATHASTRPYRACFERTADILRDALSGKVG